jgi:hypothetical protein
VQQLQEKLANGGVANNASNQVLLDQLGELEELLEDTALRQQKYERIWVKYCALREVHSQCAPQGNDDKGGITIEGETDSDDDDDEDGGVGARTSDLT